MTAYLMQCEQQRHLLRSSMDLYSVSANVNNRVICDYMFYVMPNHLRVPENKTTTYKTPTYHNDG